VSAAADAEIDKFAGVAAPVAGVAVSQTALLAVLQLTEAGVDASATGCAAAEPPAAAVKLSVVGLAVNVGVTTELTVNVTLTCTAGPAEGVRVTTPL
jgi:hypothetical protein